ncbi:hypothetical protein BESB_053920 [Besnoitia besnoiti]|uniref:Transcription factor/nuclear export subunit 2 n=1 Tax=Besnoitia besnoiti TaxID=94643 RepID=A0A2A9MHJ7_BESBE|nr:hypothetical protein BESB_053920 [Besnoitia besnoiti]PFH35741.1 hypothetical protein BESB_053920 [Besnoitia besnoiti]
MPLPATAAAPALPADTLSTLFLSPQAFSKLNNVFTAPAVLAAQPADGARNSSPAAPGARPPLAGAALTQAEAKDISRAEEAFQEALKERLALWRERCLPFLGLLITEAAHTVSSGASAASSSLPSKPPSQSSRSGVPLSASAASSGSSPCSDAAALPESFLAPYLSRSLTSFSVLSASFLRPSDEKISALFFELCVAVASGGLAYTKATDLLSKKLLPHALFHFVLIAADLRRAAALAHRAATATNDGEKVGAAVPAEWSSAELSAAGSTSASGASVEAQGDRPPAASLAKEETKKPEETSKEEKPNNVSSAVEDVKSSKDGGEGRPTAAARSPIPPEVAAIEAAIRRCFTKVPCAAETVDIPAALAFISATFFPGSASKPERKGLGEAWQKFAAAAGSSVSLHTANNVSLPACSLQSLLPLPFRALLLDAVTVTTEMCVHADPGRVEFRRAQVNLGSFLRLLEVDRLVTAVDICAFGSSIRLDDLAWPRLSPSAGGGRKRVHELLIKERTKRKFTLTVYNLCRENIGLYARLHATLLAYVESPVRISPHLCLKAVAAIVGEGSLCPSRTLATILAVYEDHLFSRNQLLPLVSLFSPEKLREVLFFELHLYAELRRQRDAAEEEAALTIVHRGTSTGALTSGSASSSQASSASTLEEMGSLARRIQLRAAEGPSRNFYHMLALFVMRGIISLEELYPYLLPADALLTALFSRTRTRYENALSQAKAGVLPASPKPQLSIQAQFDEALPALAVACGVGGDSAGDRGDTRRDGPGGAAGTGPGGAPGQGPAGGGPGQASMAGGMNCLPHPPPSSSVPPFGYYGRPPLHSPSPVTAQGPGGVAGWPSSPGGLVGSPASSGYGNSMYGYHHPGSLHHGSSASFSSSRSGGGPAVSGSLYGAPTGTPGAPGAFLSNSGYGPGGGLAGPNGASSASERDKEAREKFEREKGALEKKLIEKEKELRDRDAGDPALSLPGARHYLLHDEQGFRFALEKIYGMEIGKFSLLAAFFDLNGAAFAHQLLLHFTAKLHANPSLNGAVQKSLAGYINWLLAPLLARRPQDSLALYLAKVRVTRRGTSSPSPPSVATEENVRRLRVLCRDRRTCDLSVCSQEPYWVGSALRKQRAEDAEELRREAALKGADGKGEGTDRSVVKHEREAEGEGTGSGEARPLKRVKTERAEGLEEARDGLAEEAPESSEDDERCVGLRPAQTHEEFFLHVLPLLRYLGPSLALEGDLFCNVLSVLTGVAEAEAREPNAPGDTDPARRSQLDDVLVELVFPALSQVPYGASVVSAKIWKILQLMPASRRYTLYTRVMDAWAADVSHPLALNYEVVRVKLRKLLKRLTSTIFDDRLKTKERSLLSEITDLSRLAPFPVAELFLHQADLFDDNMVKTLAEAARGLSPLAADVFLSRFIQRQLCRNPAEGGAGGQGGGKANAELYGPPKKLNNRAALTGRFMKIHPSTDLQPLLVATILRLWRDFDASEVLSSAPAGPDEACDSLKREDATREAREQPKLVGENGHYPSDLLGFWRDKEYIEKLVELMGECPKLPEAGALTSDQIYAQGGGPLLKAEVMLTGEEESPFLSGDDEGSALACADRANTAPAALCAALSRRDIFMPLLFILAKQRVEVFYDADYTRSLQSFGFTFDDLHTYQLQLVDFFSRSLAPASTAASPVYAALLPPVRQIFSRFDPATAWTVLRPGLADFLEPTPLAPKPRPEGTPDEKATHGPADAQGENGKEQEVTKGRDEAHADEPAMRLTYSWQTEVRPIVEEYLPEKLLNGLSLDFFLLFWRLSLSDIYVPDRQYEACLARLDAAAKQSSKALEDLDKQRRLTSSTAAERQQKQTEERLRRRVAFLQRKHKALQAEWKEHKRRFDTVRRALRSFDSLDWFGLAPVPSSASSSSTASSSSSTGEKAVPAAAADTETRTERGREEGGSAETPAEVALEAETGEAGASEPKSEARQSESSPVDSEMSELQEKKADDESASTSGASSASALGGVSRGKNAGKPGAAAAPGVRKGGPLAIQAFVKYLLAPRMLNSEVDALFCSHFVTLLLDLKMPLFNYLAFTNTWTKMLTPLVRCSTVREAQLLGLFVNEVLSPLSRWLKSEKAFEAEAGGNSCFARTFRDSGSIPAAQLEKGAKKWETRIFESLVQGLPGPTVTSDSSASPSQWMGAKAVVVFLSRCHAHFPITHKRGVELMSRLEHAVELAQAWGWKDVSLSASSILKTLDKYRRDRTWYQAPTESEEKMASHSSASTAVKPLSASSSALPAKGGAKNALTSLSLSSGGSHVHASSPLSAAAAAQADKASGSTSAKKDAASGGAESKVNSTRSPRGPTKSPSTARDVPSSSNKAPAQASPPERSKSTAAPSSSSCLSSGKAAASSPRPKASAAPAPVASAARPNPRVPEPLRKPAPNAQSTEAETAAPPASGSTPPEGKKAGGGPTAECAGVSPTVSSSGTAAAAEARLEASEAKRKREASAEKSQAEGKPAAGGSERRGEASNKARKDPQGAQSGAENGAREGKSGRVSGPAAGTRGLAQVDGAEGDGKRMWKEDNDKPREKAPTAASAGPKESPGAAASSSTGKESSEERGRADANPRPATLPSDKQGGKDGAGEDASPPVKSVVNEKGEGGGDAGAQSNPRAKRERERQTEGWDAGSAAKKRETQDESSPITHTLQTEKGATSSATGGRISSRSPSRSRNKPGGKEGESFSKVDEKKPGARGDHEPNERKLFSSKASSEGRSSGDCSSQRGDKQGEGAGNPNSGGRRPSSHTSSASSYASSGPKHAHGKPGKNGATGFSGAGPQSQHFASSGGSGAGTLQPQGDRDDRGGGNGSRNSSFGASPPRSYAVSSGLHAGGERGGGGAPLPPPSGPSKWGPHGLPQGGPSSAGHPSGPPGHHHHHNSSSFYGAPPPPSALRSSGHNNVNYSGPPQYGQGGNPNTYGGGPHGNAQGHQGPLSGPGGPQARNALFGGPKGQHSHRSGGGGGGKGPQAHHRSSHHYQR